MNSPENPLVPERNSRYDERVFSERARLWAACTDAARSQRQVLEDLVRFNAGAAFGKAHGFAGIRTLEDFREAVPPQDYTGTGPASGQWCCPLLPVRKPDDG